MTIKEQIQKKINGYKKDFYEECGFHIVVIPQIGIRKIPLYNICNYCCYFLDIPTEDLHTNKKLSVVAKEFITGICLKMGYAEQEVYKALDLDRTSLYNVYDRFCKKLEETRSYKYEFYKFMEYLYQQDGHEENKTPTRDWNQRVDYLDLIFLEEVSIKRKERKPYKASKGTEATIQYLRREGPTKGTVVFDYLIEHKYFKTRRAATNTMNNLKKANKVKRVNGYWEAI